MSRSLRYLLLFPVAGVVVLLVMLTSGPMSSNALLLLALASAILLATAAVWSRREGLVSPIPIVSLALLVYFPLRGILLLTSALTPEQGLNANVSLALNGTASMLASVEILVVALLFGSTCEVAWRLVWVRRSAIPSSLEHEPRNLTLTRLGTALLVVGLVGQLLLIPTHLDFLQGDEASGGFLVQVVYLAAFAFGLGLILSGRANRAVPPFVWVLLTAVAAISFYTGSKDTLVQALLALLFAGATVTPARRRSQVVVVGLVIGVLVFLVFPAVMTYRRQITDGQTVAQALQDVPSELVSKTPVTGAPRSGGVVGYLEDSLLYMTNRLQGFDSLVLAAHAQQDAHVLDLQTIVLSPLGLLLPSSSWSSTAPQVGHYFAQQYWGSVPTNNVSIAITVFGEAQLAFGMIAVLPVAVLLGLVTAVAARQFRSPRRAMRAVGFVFMVTAVGFERDVLLLIITTERRLALVAIVVGLAALGRRRIAEPAWRVAEAARG